MTNDKKLSRPLAFLYAAANNVVRKHQRDRQDAATTDPRQRGGIPDPEFEAFCVAIGRLPARYREAFVLRKVYQYSYDEIATHCGISRDAVKKHVKEGFKLVQAYLDEKD